MKTILLMEDNAEMRENISEILELSGYNVIAKENGKKGVEAAKSNAEKISLILCDIMMPELDGYSVLHILSKLPSTAPIPFIFLTAKSEKEDFRVGMNLGADDYITKPFGEIELLSTIENRIKKAEMFRTIESESESLDHFIDLARGVNELENLSKDRKSITYKKKETIFHEGDFPNNLYYIASGNVKLFKMNQEGKEYITGLFKEGEFFGFISLLENSAYKETAQALEESKVFLIPKQDFISLLNNNRDVSAQFIKMLSNNLIEKEEKLLQLAYDSVRKRVAEGILEYKKNYQQEKENAPFPISREDLANTVGTSTESVIRTLHDFKEEKLIEISGRNIHVLDEAKLINLRF